MSQLAILTKTFTATEALERFRRVKLTSGSGTAVEYADAGEAFIGVTEAAAALGDPVTVRLKGDYGTFRMVAAGAVVVGSTIYGAADGKVDDAVSGTAIGTALEAASGNGSVIECFLDGATAAQYDGSALQNYAVDGNGQAPIVFYKSIASTGIDTPVTIDTVNRKMLLIDWWVISRDTTAANIKLIDDSTDMTEVLAKGTADKTTVRAGAGEGEIIAAADEIAAGSVLKVNGSADCAVDVFAVFLPIA